MTALARRFGPAVLALIVLAALVLTTVLTAGSTDSTALSRAHPVGALPSGPLPSVSADDSCQLGAPSAAVRGGLTLGGACVGVDAGRLACQTNDDGVAASLQNRLADGRTLTLTVIVPDFPEPGAHDDADLFVQVSRTGGAQRWSQRGIVVHVAASGVMSLAGAMTADPGTQTSGTVRIRGTMRCESTA